jgi:3-isopropylmalate/(R)-2-methylmalate dehydratase small subunit
MAVLDSADVDTDQIVPKQFLKRIERTGFGEFLFFDWAKEDGFELNDPAARPSSSPAATSAAAHRGPRRGRPGLRLVIVAPSFGDIFRTNSQIDSPVLPR